MVENNLYRQLLEEFKDDIDFKIAGLITDITEDVCEIMDEKNINRASLATIMETSKAAITKMLNGNTNFTLKRLLKVAIALEKELDISFKEPKRAMSFNVKTETIHAPTKLESSSWTTLRRSEADLPIAGKEKLKVTEAA